MSFNSSEQFTQRKEPGRALDVLWMTAVTKGKGTVTHPLSDSWFSKNLLSMDVDDFGYRVTNHFGGHDFLQHPVF